jgi:hypothetical protein
MQAFVTEVAFEQTGGIALMGRGKSLSGSYFQQADFSSIVLKVFDMADSSAPVNGASGETIAPSSVIFNALQTSDARWTLDATGYNFRYLTSAAQLPGGGKKYRFEFKFIPTSGSSDAFWAVFEVPTLGLYSA